MVKKNLFEDEEEEQTQQQTKNKKSKKAQQGEEQNDEDVNVKLKVNKKFAQNFEKKIQRQLIDKAKAMYGADYEKKIAEGNDDDESSDVEEDSDGELLNEKVNDKFIETLAKIRLRDPSIYKNDKKFFKEKDFEVEQNDKKSSKKEKMTYAAMVRKEALEKMEKEDFSSEEDDYVPQVKGETIAEEQKRLKDEFKNAAKKVESDDDEEEEEADAIFTQKKKSLQQIEDENKEYSKFLEKVKRKKQRKGKEQDVEVLQNFWGDASKLDDTDKFLRKYILTKGWVDRDDMGLDEEFEDKDLEEDDEADRFEAKYNFRYEEPGANEVVTYGRKVQDSLRQKDSTRAEKRKEREERKKEEKKKIDEEMKQMKAATRNAILDRVHKIQEIAGTKEIKTDINKLLEEDFDDQKFSKYLDKQFDSDYYEEEDSHLDELKEYEKNLKKQEKQEQQMELEKLGIDKKQIKKIEKSVKKAADKEDDEEISSDWSDLEEEEDDMDEELDENNDIQIAQQDDDKDNVLNVKTNIPLAIKKNLKDNEIQAMTQSDKGEDGLYLWWYCDNCKKGIQPGQFRFDCQECPDYTLCKICNEGQFHDHPLKKQIVPKNCVPPTDEEIQELLQEYQVCKKCNIKLDDYCSYYQLNSNNEVILCDECFDKEKIVSKKLYSYIEAKKVDLEAVVDKDPQALKKYISDEEIQNLVDQYYNLDYEDVITGGIKTRFKYMEVKPDSYGLSDEQLLYADTNVLNKYVSIKKLAPYRDDEGFVKSKNLKNKSVIKQIEKSTKINKVLQSFQKCNHPLTKINLILIIKENCQERHRKGAHYQRRSKRVKEKRQKEISQGIKQTQSRKAKKEIRRRRKIKAQTCFRRFIKTRKTPSFSKKTQILWFLIKINQQIILAKILLKCFFKNNIFFLFLCQILRIFVNNLSFPCLNHTKFHFILYIYKIIQHFTQKQINILFFLNVFDLKCNLYLKHSHQPFCYIYLSENRHNVIFMKKKQVKLFLKKNILF
ncbi:KRI1 family carboxy-terminal protein (macronuclear) [Tetrahymena thermophila SB210]|uniref:KRI1 family carboxy-terminal protein n=1 Tax=Tetrahymena thermophila (strain SB210) TaxID=312017 RepID=I7LV02_TETTS|nr:KRI1 family carboxy-terminal protein [Tetrahymena thermophila SB210]EAR96396.3 KRI1 family carboxy-terminal protein [Tetrahymena thermophila SB210]|eukprot:XP_001016641.3 KRI1 family carboxy-terminal protein [Tetrahymena thermophila SB210]